MDRPGPPPGLGGLFAGFFMMGAQGFGGVLPWARRVVVERRRWMTPAEFNDLLALCQFLPGPNVINLSVAMGARFRGVLGSLAAFTGLMAAPMAIVIGLGLLYARFGQVPAVGRAFAALAAAASGLVLATALKIAAPLPRTASAIGMAAVTFVAVALLRLPLVPAMLVLAPVSVLLAARAPR